MQVDPQVDAPLIVASLSILLILASSLALWVRHIQKPESIIEQDPGTPAWPIGWVNFGIFVCAMIIFVYMAQVAASLLFFDAPAEGEGPPELTPWLAVLAVLCLQLPMLAVFYGARRLYPSLYASRLDNTKLSIFTSFKKALRLFLMLLPGVWIAALLWAKVLSGFEGFGLIEDLEQQDLVTLFQGGGDPIAIGLLVIAAVILAPIVEELIFRGCLYRFLKSQTTLLPAQIASGILFSMIHWNLLSFLPLVLVGIFLARIYEKT
ncbi:MAG: CPBP family intramembrane metalloprotease, partial [Puniceicoccaceae bacterium]|nr:CPBP family intramembrane metalloprotease [Puniceicoccaceae bacterium]